MAGIHNGGPLLTSADERELDRFLRDLHFLPPAASSPGNRNSGDSDEADPLLLVRAPVMKITKWAAGVIGGIGVTASSALAAIGTWLGGLSSDERVAFIAAAAFLLAAVAGAAAWVVVADVQARRALTQQKYIARADIANKYLQLACSGPHAANSHQKQQRPVTVQDVGNDALRAILLGLEGQPKGRSSHP